MLLRGFLFVCLFSETVCRMGRRKDEICYPFGVETELEGAYSDGTCLSSVNQLEVHVGQVLKI